MLMSVFNLSALALFVAYGELGEVIVTVLVFVILGLILFAISFVVLDKFMPYSVHKEIEKDQNTSLGIIIGAMLLGIAIIIAAAIHG